MNLTDIILFSLKHPVSDIHISATRYLTLRIDNKIVPFKEFYFDAQWLEEQLFFFLTEEEQKMIHQHRQIDFSLKLYESNQRLRGNIFYHHQGISAAFRPIPTQIPSLDTLLAPAVIKQLILNKSGLILVTGATGSGKSTTLAAMIDDINRYQQKHIITLEDPIEFIHSNHCSLIHQREMGKHVHSFQSAMHAALRQDPDIILLGEIRDLSTIRLALTAAETGHLVLATLHTCSAIQSIERLVDVFSGEEKYFVRQQLAQSLLAIISQQLLIKKGGKGRLAAFEVLINTPAIAHLIREGKNHQIATLIQTGQEIGMQNMQKGIANIQEQIMIER